MVHQVITWFLFWTVWSFIRNWCNFYWERHWELWLWDMLQSK